MAASTTKKALIRRYDRETLAGYINPLAFQQSEGVELLSADGNVTLIPYSAIKLISFVKEFDASTGPERLVFQTRPKTEGLWINLRFRDGACMQGIIPNDLMLLEPTGFTVIPPDAFGNQQRLWVPRASLIAVEVLGVVGSPLAKRKPKPAPKDQIGLFDD